MRILFFLSLTLFSLCFGQMAFGQQTGKDLERQAWNSYEKGYDSKHSPEDQAKHFDEAARLYEAAAEAYEKAGQPDKAKGARNMANGARQNAENRRKMAENANALQQQNVSNPSSSPPGSTGQIRATGRTTGHVADLKLINPSSKPMDVTLPGSAVIPSDGRHQGYAIPTTPGKVTVPSGQTITIPLDGYCTHPDLPAAPAGTPLPGLTDWPPSVLPTPQTVRTLETTARRLHDHGVIRTPFGDPSIVVQHSFWDFAADYDPCARLRRQMEEAGVPQDAIPDAIAQVVDAMLTTGREAGLPGYQPTLPILPMQPATPPAPGAVRPTVTVSSTGQTTGHIGNITVSNPTDLPIYVVIGGGGSAYIPSQDNAQPYVVPSLPRIPVPPKGKTTTPIHGYCADVRRPPVPADNTMPSISEWITTLIEEGVPDQTNVVRIPAAVAPPLSEVIRAMENTPLPPVASKWDCPPLPPAPGQPLLPGTNTPIRTPITASENPGLLIPLLLDAISRIEDAYDQLRGTLTTPFSNNPPKEREAIIQQTFWLYSAGLEGKPYGYKDFHDNTVKQFEDNTGRPYNSLPPDQKEKLNKGVDDFWEAFTATGAEAKILPKAPRPEPKMDDFWDSYRQGGGKPKRTTTAPAPSDPKQMTTRPEEPPVQIQNRPKQERQGEKKCECGSVSFELQVWTWGKDGTGKDAAKGSPHKQTVSGSAAPGQSAQGVSILKSKLPNRPANDDKYLIAVRNIKADCPCTEWTEAIEQAVKDLAKAERDNASKISKAKEALDKAQKELDEKEAKLAEEKVKKNPNRITLDKLGKEVQKAKEKKEKAEAALAELENPIKAKERELEDLKKSAKKSDCEVYTDDKNADSKLPQVAAKGANVRKIEENPGGGKLPPAEHYYSFIHDPVKPLTYEITISFYCKGTGCKPVSCSRTFIVKVEE